VRILTVESDFATTEWLKSEGFNVYTTNHGGEAVDLGRMYDYDCITLTDMPDLTVCDMVKSLRLAKVKTPIIAMMRVGLENVVRALDLGADDVLKGTAVYKDELVARIHAIVRRSKGHAESLVQVGDLRVNLTTKTVTVAGAPVHLTGKEYQMLELLALRKGSLITKEMFLNHLYGGMDEPELKIIDVFICKLRKKLPPCIETVWGRGYVLRVAAEGVESPSLAPEMADFRNDPPIFVTRRTFAEATGVEAKRRFGTPRVAK
jgi:two-component system cell cycle response regulator CtrA